MILALLFALPVIFDGGDTSRYQTVPAPRVQYRMNMAAATRSPWVDSNIWIYRRAPEKKYLCDVRKASVVLAMAEAYSQNVDVALQITPEQKKDFDRMTEFLKSLPEGPRTPWVNFTVTDDGSEEAGEALKLLSRRNLLYAKQAPGGVKLQLNKEILDPYQFAVDVRDRLGDENRLLRLYGSELVIATVAREGPRVRIYLVHYGERSVEGMRIRIKGRYPAARIKPYLFGIEPSAATEVTHDGGFTEFTLAKAGTFSVIDLSN